MNDYIRKAVDLAAGWERISDDVWMPLSGWPEGFLLPKLLGQVECDALAAQLVRQVDATEQYIVQTSKKWAEVSEPSGDIHTYADVDDRTMNTIKAIVDSDVLNNG